jgi:hypothetical protein
MLVPWWKSELADPPRIVIPLEFCDPMNVSVNCSFLPLDAMAGLFEMCDRPAEFEIGPSDTALECWTRARFVRRELLFVTKEDMVFETEINSV